MIGAVYVEEGVRTHPRTRALLERLHKLPHIPVQSYGEVFNRRGQNFRLQKSRPSLILADKPDGHVQETPPGYGIGGERNFYFSHLLNCPYDCRYCFLQGMYASANYVLFVDYERFFDGAAELAKASPNEPSWFFSGYDADSLALEGLTGFLSAAVPAFREIPDAHLEVRTKSAAPGPLLRLEAHPRCVIALTLTPQAISEEVEIGVPPLERRLRMAARLAERGWPIGLRFDPLVWQPGCLELYRDLFARVFAAIPRGSVHSVSLGTFRLPAAFHKKLEKLHPDAPLVQAGPFENYGGMVSYRRDLERRLVETCTAELLRYIPEEIFFPCPLPALETDPALESVRPTGASPG